MYMLNRTGTCRKFAWIFIMERNYELLTSTLFLVKVTFFDFSIEYFIQNKHDEWFEM